MTRVYACADTMHREFGALTGSIALLFPFQGYVFRGRLNFPPGLKVDQDTVELLTNMHTFICRWRDNAQRSPFPDKVPKNVVSFLHLTRMTFSDTANR